MSMFTGKEIRGYKIQEFLGKGSFAFVYKAINLKTKQAVALKIIDNSIEIPQENVKENVQNEVNILKSLNHQNIIKCYESFQEKGQWYIVTQYCGKGDFQKYFKQIGKLDQIMARSCIIKLLDSLAYLHSNKIVHRDLKLANILINDQFDIKLADLGYSKNYEQHLLVSRVGTPMTMAPEILFDPKQYQKFQNYSQKCDTWSLGVIAYQLICGQYPYKPQKGKGIEGLRQNIKNSQKIIYSEKIQISQLAKDFINKCLKINPDHRPYIQQLKQHEWIQNYNQMSIIRKQIMRKVLGSNSSIVDKFKYVLHTEISKHTQDLIIRTFMTNDEISRKLRQFESLYPKNYQNYMDLLYLLMHRNSDLEKVKIKIICKDKQYEIISSQIRIFKNHTSTLSKLLNDKEDKIKQKFKITVDRVNYSDCARNLLKFIVKEGLQKAAPSIQIIELWKGINQMIEIVLIQTSINLKFKYNRKQTQQLNEFINHSLNNKQILQIINNENLCDYSQQQKNQQWLIKHEYLSYDKQKQSHLNYELSIFSEILQRSLNSKFKMTKDKKNTQKS